MVPAVDNICEPFTHNLLTRAQGRPKFLSLMGIHKECITKEIKFESNFGGGKNGRTCVSMGK